jgi:hypothetical protein
MNQWISAVNAYYYPYMCYHVSHERNVFPQLGIPSDEKVVAHALPKVEVQVIERELSHGKEHLFGSELTLADLYLLPITFAFGFAPEAQAMYPKFPAICAWRERMEILPIVKRFRATQPPRGRSSMRVSGWSRTVRNTEFRARSTASGRLTCLRRNQQLMVQGCRLPVRWRSSKLCAFF